LCIISQFEQSLYELDQISSYSSTFSDDNADINGESNGQVDGTDDQSNDKFPAESGSQSLLINRTKHTPENSVFLLNHTLSGIANTQTHNQLFNSLDDDLHDNGNTTYDDELINLIPSLIVLLTIVVQRSSARKDMQQRFIKQVGFL
jgi:hypothetical protein